MRHDLLIDTGVFLAAADSDEPTHTDCAPLLQLHRRSLTTTAPVVAEAAWLIESRLGPKAESRFLTLAASGRLNIVDLTQADYQRCVELIDQYADLGLGLVDASLVVIAERHKITTIATIATLNTRDFRVVRPNHTDAFTIVP